MYTVEPYFEMVDTVMTKKVPVQKYITPKHNNGKKVYYIIVTLQ